MRVFRVSVAGVLSLCSLGQAGTLQVLSVDPEARSIGAALNTPISIDFDRPLNTSSVALGESLWAFGRWSGRVEGSLSFHNGDQTARLTPAEALSAGESVMVILSHDLQADDGSFLRQAGYSFQFWARALPANLEFSEADRVPTFAPPEDGSRAYGGIGSDVNNDGWLDITIVNEDTADLRVFLNNAAGDGTYADYLQPTYPLALQASANEPSDFNRDGVVDICVADGISSAVSILLGNGDGTFGAQQIIPVGSNVRGIAVLDFDGDGDVDIVNTNNNSGNLSSLVNDGSGVFGAPTFFDGGVGGEWAVAAADMNEDGILDLVVGGQGSDEISVMTGNGDGTFTLVGTQASGGNIWMFACGDVNGDGHDDVSGVNSSQNNGVILLGDGTGQLAPPVLHGTDSFPLATDLGDLDGDGDLDWITSSFGGDWFLFLNDGAGNFTFEQEFDATVAASCAVMMDIDNDLDLDLALIDEIEDEIILLANTGSAVPAMGTWGAYLLVALLTACGVFVLRRRTAGASGP